MVYFYAMADDALKYEAVSIEERLAQAQQSAQQLEREYWAHVMALRRLNALPDSIRVAGWKSQVNDHALAIDQYKCAIAEQRKIIQELEGCADD